MRFSANVRSILVEKPAALFLGLACLTAAASISAGQNTGLVMNSPDGEPVGDGYYYYYTPGDGGFQAEKNYRNGVTVSFTGPVHHWTLFFAAPGKLPLSPGTYDGAVRFGDLSSSENENLPQMEVSGDGRGLLSLNGTFTVKEIVYGSGNTILAFHAVFSQRETDRYAQPPPNYPALTGEILFNASAPLPPDESKLHPPEEILYEAVGDGVVTFRQDGTPLYTRGPANGTKMTSMAFDRRGCYYVGGWDKYFIGGEVIIFGTLVKNDGGNNISSGPIDGFYHSTITALACDRSDNLFVAEAAPVPQITKVTPAGEKTVFASGLSSPSVLAFDSAGNLYEADSGTKSIWKFTPAGEKSLFRYGYPNVSAMIFDAQDTLIVASSGTESVSRLTAEGSTVLASGFKDPQSLAIDKAGDVYVGDHDEVLASGDHQFSYGTIYKCAADGTKTQFAESLGYPHAMAFAPHPIVVPINISTRAQVGTKQNVLISGFIVSGAAPKKVIIRGIGPSLSGSSITNPLADPLLELHDSAGNILASNDNWRDIQMSDIASSGLAPENDEEAAVMAILREGAYTAVLTGKNGGEGVGLLEIYDVDATASARLANISTRSFVNTSDGVMIGGFILGAGIRDSSVIVRALGPSLAKAGIDEPLADPTLELRDKNGTLVRSNDNWRESQESVLQNTGIAPNDDRESAVAATLSAGNYTAIVRGKNDAIGVGLVEVYHLESN
jgi:hypothetical protein